jgi:hypothetical protein
MVKKIFTVSFIILIIMQNLSAAIDENDATDDKKIIPYIESENESEINAKNDESDTLPGFTAYNNKTNLEMGLKFRIGKYFEITPMIGASDLMWTIDNQGVFGFNEAGLYTGSYFNFIPNEIVTISTWLCNMEKFEPDSVMWFGLKTGLGFDIDIEKAYIEIEIKDDFTPLFQSGKEGKLTTSLSNSLEYLFVFNFLNFINEKINTGFYTEGKFDSESLFCIEGYYSTSLCNEFYAGLTTNPVEYFEGHFAFAMFNQITVNRDGTAEEGSKTLDIGLKVGVSFNYKWFSLAFDYVPHIFTSIDDVRDKVNHFFYLTASIYLEKE